jgi:hypothetical protein
MSHGEHCCAFFDGGRDRRLDPHETYVPTLEEWVAHGYSPDGYDAFVACLKARRGQS